jgi:hypothetical protein
MIRDELGSRASNVDGVDLVVPDTYAPTPPFGPLRYGRGCSCDREHHAIVVKRDIDERKLRMLALAEEHAVLADQHESPVVADAGGEELGAVERDAAGTFDRIHMERCDAHTADLAGGARWREMARECNLLELAPFGMQK